MVTCLKPGLVFIFIFSYFPVKHILLKAGEFIWGNHICLKRLCVKIKNCVTQVCRLLWRSGRQKHKNLLREGRREIVCLLMSAHWPVGKRAINYLPLPIIRPIKRDHYSKGKPIPFCLRHNQLEHFIRYSNFLSTQQSQYPSTYN